MAGDFKGKTFSAQNVTPKDDGALYNAHCGDGILNGCDMNLIGDDLVIQPGHIIACGRVCQVDGATNIDLSSRTLQTGYIQIIMNYDLSQGEGAQWYITWIERQNNVFDDLTQEDINGVGTLYQFEIARIQISGGALSNIVSSLGISMLTVNHPTEGRALIFEGSGGAGFSVHDADDNSIGGMSAFWPTTGGTAVTIYGDERAIRLRPNGIASADGQLAIFTGGEARLTPSTGSGELVFGAGSTGVSVTRNDNGRTGGMSMYAVGGTDIYDDTGTGIYLSPNGLGQTSGRCVVRPNGNVEVFGQVVGGVTVAPSKNGTVTASANTRTIICTSNALAGGLYAISIYGRTAPTSATGHYPFFGYAVNGSDKKYHTVYSASTGQKYAILSDFVQVPNNGTISVVYQGGVQASVYASLDCYRIA